MSKIFIGNLPDDIRTRDVEDVFEKFGKITTLEMKRPYGKAPYCFLEFTDHRDSKDAIAERNGYKVNGVKIRVEMSYGRKHFQQGPSYTNNTHDVKYYETRNARYWITVKGLPPTVSWQDLKDHMKDLSLRMRHVNVYGATGIVTFDNRDEMEQALDILEDTKIRSHRGDSAHIKVKEGRFESASPDRIQRRPRSNDSRDRRMSRSPRSRSRSITPERKHRSSKRSKRSRSKSPSRRRRTRSRTRSSISKRRKSSRSESDSKTPIDVSSTTGNDKNDRKDKSSGSESDSDGGHKRRKESKITRV